MRGGITSTKVLLVIGMILLAVLPIISDSGANSLYYSACSYVRGAVFQQYDGGRFIINGEEFNFDKGIIAKKMKTREGIIVELYPSFYNNKMKALNYCGKTVHDGFRVFIYESTSAADGLQFEEYLRSLYNTVKMNIINDFDLTLYERKISKVSTIIIAVGVIEKARFLFQGISKEEIKPSIRVRGLWSRRFEVRFFLRNSGAHSDQSDPYELVNWKMVSKKVYSMIERACGNKEFKDSRIKNSGNSALNG